MPKIIVDTTEIMTMAEEIESYVETHKSAMTTLNGVFDSLKISESGEEFDKLQKKWSEVNSRGSTSQSMITQLETYARYLRCCAKNYNTAQNNAKNRASRI